MRELAGHPPVATLIGDSPVMHRIFDQIQKAALTEVPVLITGDSGTGKEVAARLLHQLSTRRTRKFLKVDCPAIPTQSFDRDFFGYETGSTHQVGEATAGTYEQANNGTLFLDHIDELDLRLQTKLLHALQDVRGGTFGTAAERPVDIRLVCASSQEIEPQVTNGTFRSDLFYRINVLRIRMPSLRERPSDVPILMKHFIAIYSVVFGRTPDPPRSAFMKLLQSYRWPGNIRELENFAKQYVVLGGEEHVLCALRDPEQLRLLSSDVVDLTVPLRVQTKRAAEQAEKTILIRVLDAHEWNRRKAARSLDISYRTLLMKIKRSGLPTARYNKLISSSLPRFGVGEMLPEHRAGSS